MDNAKPLSFIQEQKHATKSERFAHVKPEYVEQVLSGHGFRLVALKTGRALLPDRAGHQTTVARYRSEREFEINGLKLDIVARIPHLYGAMELFIGTYRQICSNGLVVGEKFETFRVKHLGDPIGEIDSIIPRLVAQERLLIDTIERMRATVLTDSERVRFAQIVAARRLDRPDAVGVASDTLLIPRRADDTASDLFTVMNVVQENSFRARMGYAVPVRRADGSTAVRQMFTRRVSDQSERAISLNRMIWDTAAEFLKVG